MRLKKLTIYHLKRRYYYFEGNQHLCQYYYEHEKSRTEHDEELESLKLVKHE